MLNEHITKDGRRKIWKTGFGINALSIYGWKINVQIELLNTNKITPMSFKTKMNTSLFTFNHSTFFAPIHFDPSMSTAPI